MQKTLNVIVLSKLRFKDNDLIIKTYTKENGIVSYLLKGVLSSKKHKKSAYCQLLSQLQIETDFKDNRSLQYVKDVKNNYLYSSLHTNIYKSAIVMFLSEVLSSVLNEEEQNDTLYSYIETALQWLDLHDEFSNFHLLFLLNLTKHLGFYPDTSQIDLDYFNLVSGDFKSQQSTPDDISGKQLLILKQLLGINFDTLNQVKLSANERQEFLNTLLKYYNFHLGGFKKPTSHYILNDVFS